MKTDRELLELVAKAQGWIDYPEDSAERGAYWHTDPARAPFGPRITKSAWNPFTNDGDALRLAVDLELDIMRFPSFGEVHATTQKGDIGAIEQTGDNGYAATRRAIVRAAAAIGESL